MKRQSAFGWRAYLLWSVVLLATVVLCCCVGSVMLPISDVLKAFLEGLLGTGGPLETATEKILLSVRLPRVLCVALMGAALSLCGAAMQGLLRNPLADGSTLGVSSGASLGGALAIALGISLPGFHYAGIIVMAMLFAFGSLLLIMGLAYALDRSLKTHTVILIGVVFTMLSASLINLITVFSSESLKSIAFWTMGSLTGSNFINALTLLLALAFCACVLMSHARELNAFAMGEEDAASLGVPVKRVKFVVLLTVSAMIGVCVSIGGNIGFVGLMVPHAMRMVVGQNYRRLLPASLFAGAVFLLLADLLARTLLNPVELPIGVVTSLIGAAAFLWIFYHYRKARK